MNCIFRIARTLWLGRTAKFCIVLSAPKINRLKLQSAQITGQFESIHLCFPSSLSVKVLSHCNQNQTQDAVCSCFTFHDQIRNNYGTWSELEIKKFARGIRIDFLYFWFQYRTALSTVHTDLDKTTEPWNINTIPPPNSSNLVISYVSLLVFDNTTITKILLSLC